MAIICMILPTFKIEICSEMYLMIYFLVLIYSKLQFIPLLQCKATFACIIYQGSKKAKMVIARENSWLGVLIKLDVWHDECLDFIWQHTERTVSPDVKQRIRVCY